MEEKDEIKYEEIVAQIAKYLDETKAHSSHSYQQYITDAVNEIGDDTGIINQILNSGTTITYDKEYTLTQDKGYFVYWLMMHFAFLEDQGFKSKYPIVSRNVSTGWGRTILNSGTYNNTDKAFLQEVSEWMKKKDWVYKKPILNEHNDTLPLIQRLPITATKVKV